MNYIKTKQELKELVENNEKVIIDFFATWCGPCKMLGPVLEEVANERIDIVFAKVDVDEAEELAEAFQIRSVPTLFFVKNAKVAFAKLGFQPKNNILQIIAEYLGK